MQRFEFRLERVLKWKKRRELLAEMRQKQARVAYEGAKAQVQFLWDRLAENAGTLEAQLRDSMHPSSWMACYQHSAQLGQVLDAAEASVRRTRQQLDQANAARARIAAEVEALLYLKRRQWEEHQRAAAQATRTAR